MDWKALGKKIASIGAPLLGGAIGGPAGAALGGIVAEALGVETNDPNEIALAIDKDPAAAVKLKEIQAQERIRLQEIASAQALAEIQAETEQHRTINETMRAELLASDNFRARWRPTFGYIMAANMAMISIAFFWAVGAIIWQPSDSGAIAKGFSEMLESFLLIFSLGLGVLGIQVHQRSREKIVAGTAATSDVTLTQKIREAIRGEGAGR